MIIFCAGLRSSASTLQWQITSEIVGTQGFVVNRSDKIKKYFDTNETVVAKQHKLKFENYIKNSDAKILMTVRDLRDVQASLMMRWKKPFDYCFGKLKTFTKQQLEWMVFHEKMHFAKYEKWTLDIESETMRIASFLNIDIQEMTCKKISQKYSLQNNRLRLPKNHITDAEIGKYHNILTERQISTIEKEFSEWLELYNYL